MDFPITSEKILAYATQSAISACCRIRQRLIDDVDTDPTRIREMLQAEVHDNVYKNRGKIAYSIHLGNVRDTIADFNREDVLTILQNDFVEPLIRRYFPDAVMKVGIDSDIYLLFTLQVADQTSNRSR